MKDRSQATEINEYGKNKYDTIVTMPQDHKKNIFGGLQLYKK